MGDDNLVDIAQRARTSTDKLKQAAREEAIDLGPQLIGALQGLGEEIRCQRTVTERLITELGEQRHTATRMIDALNLLTTELSRKDR